MAGSGRLTYEALAELTRRLGTMLSSGLDLAAAFNRVWEQERRPAVKKLYGDILMELYNGMPLSDALAMQGTAFPVWMVHMVRAGESGGEMAQILRQITDSYEKEAEQRRKIQGACLYPGFLLALTAASLGVLFTVVLPELFDVFDGVEQLPAGTRFLMAASGFLKRDGYGLCLLLAGLSILAVYLLSLEPVHILADRLKLKLPILGRWLREIYTARFARGFSLLYTRGVPIMDAVGASAAVTGNRWLEQRIVDSAREMLAGVPLSRALEGVSGLDEKLAANLRIGEESGRVQELLLPMADRFDWEADVSIQRLIQLIEPVLIVFMAAIIGFVMWSVIMPVYQYYQSLI